jgi:hypothetical protein
MVFHRFVLAPKHPTSPGPSRGLCRSGKVSGGAGRSEVPQDRPTEADGGAGRRGWTTGMD